MNIYRVLDRVLDSGTKIKILRFLCRTNAEWNGRQIAKEISVSPSICHKTLKGLLYEDVLLLKNTGKSFVYRLNSANIIVKGLLAPLFRAEENIPKELFGIIRKELLKITKEGIISIAVFGSVSKKEEMPESDIDIFVITTAAWKEKVERVFSDLSAKIHLRFGNTISPYIKSVDEFRREAKRQGMLIKNIMESHVLIYGLSLEGIINGGGKI